jgi:hypothetical protein
MLGRGYVGVIISPRYPADDLGENWTRPRMTVWLAEAGADRVRPLSCKYEWED